MIELLAASKLTWYVARASGIVLWVLSASAVLWGVLMASPLPKRRGLPAWLLDLHRYLGSLSIVFLVLHLVSLRLDRFQPFYAGDLFLLQHSNWKPDAVAWGIVSMYLLLIVQFTSALRRHLRKRLWHLIHLLSIPMLLTGTIHAITAGTDLSNNALRISGFFLASFVAVALGRRILAGRFRARRANSTIDATRASPRTQNVPGSAKPVPEGSLRIMG